MLQSGVNEATGVHAESKDLQEISVTSVRSDMTDVPEMPATTVTTAYLDGLATMGCREWTVALEHPVVMHT